MRSPAALPLAMLAVGVLAPPAAADTVRFDRGEGTSISDGKIICVMGVDDRGVGSVHCSGARVWALWERRARCQVMDGDQLRTTTGDRSIRLKERGRTTKDAICGVGGAKDADRGDAIVLGGIRGKRLRQGGFTFENRDGHGFTLTAGRLRRF